MGILSWLVLGLVAGLLAGFLMKGGGYGVIGDIVLGILGALVGGFLSSTFLGADVSGFNVTSVVIAVLGACLLIGLSRAIGPHRPRGARA
jgi:uncharacterized membrane protein YeaQ/YmgE (transglycosylase-associated protein family)